YTTLFRSPGRERNSSLLVSARQFQAHVRQRRYRRRSSGRSGLASARSFLRRLRKRKAPRGNATLRNHGALAPGLTTPTLTSWILRVWVRTCPVAQFMVVTGAPSKEIRIQSHRRRIRLRWERIAVATPKPAASTAAIDMRLW